MAKKKMDTKGFISMAIYWAVYLTITQVILGSQGIAPGSVPGGVIGWGVFAELPRAIVGLLIMRLIWKE